MMATLADKVDFDLIKSPSDEEQPVAFHFTDNNISVDYVLAAIGVILVYYLTNNIFTFILLY